MRDRIDIQEAIRLYHVWRNWREVASRLTRPNGATFTTASIINAVRRHDLGEVS